MPQKIGYDGIDCYQYSINTLISPINILVPQSMLKDNLAFNKAMTEIELHIANQDVESSYNCLSQLVNKEDLTEKIACKLKELANSLVELEIKKWNSIWARIIASFLSTANLGKFDVIVGNPPWVDWKNLPSGYRDRIKSLCISRNLFSGDRLTGGINLNICALISCVAAENWLSPNGILAFLMPETLIYQQSYEGFRNLYMEDGKRLYFQKFTNWTKSGNPFKPISQKFMTYFISSKEKDYSKGVSINWYLLKEGKILGFKEELDVKEFFEVKSSILAKLHTNKNFFTHIENDEQLRCFSKITGVSKYIGREGIEFYPQKLMVFTLTDDIPSTSKCTGLKNIQVKKSKYPIAEKVQLLETGF